MSAPAYPEPPAREPLPRDTVVHVAGHHGLVGSAIWRHLRGLGFTRLVGRRSDELDLRDSAAVERFYDAHRPQAVILAAARVGGIAANAAEPVEFLSDNLRIQLNVLDAALARRVPRLLFLGSSCIYPRLAPQPLREEALLTGPLEPTNDAYAIAKIAGITGVRAARREYGLRWSAAMPTNLYGPGDSFDPGRSHVLPALLRRLHEAARAGEPSVTCWGTGEPRREFLHVDDLARACLTVLEHPDATSGDDTGAGIGHLNVGTGEDLTIRELAGLVADTVGFRGTIHWDPDRPDGTPRKLLDVSRIKALGWEPRIGLADGLRSTYRWYLDHEDQLDHPAGPPVPSPARPVQAVR